MKRKHVHKMYLDWSEDRLSTKQRRAVQKHLQDCPGCREYFRKMSVIFSEKADLSALPNLPADPYLPVRIKALAGGETGRLRQPEHPWAGALRWAFATLALFVAVLIGVYFGKNLAAKSAPPYSETQLLGEYYQAFAQQSYSEAWESLLGNENATGEPLYEERP